MVEFNHTLNKEKSMFGFGVGELAIILVIALIIFGAGKLPEIGGAVGKTIKNFQKEIKGNKNNQPQIIEAEVKQIDDAKN